MWTDWVREGRPPGLQSLQLEQTHTSNKETSADKLRSHPLRRDHLEGPELRLGCAGLDHGARQVCEHRAGGPNVRRAHPSPIVKKAEKNSN